MPDFVVPLTRLPGEQEDIILRPTLDGPVDELAIRYGYLYLLGRDPENDQVVLENLGHRRAEGATIRQHRQIIMRSPEYRAKSPDERNLRFLHDPADVVAYNYAYLYLLRRNPESEEVLRVHAERPRTIQALLNDMLKSREYVSNFGNAALNVSRDTHEAILRRNILENLSLDPQIRPRRVLILGQCQAETLLEACLEIGWQADHFLYHFVDVTSFAYPTEQDYDAVIVATRSTQILGRASVLLGDEAASETQTAGQLAYFRHPRDELLAVCLDILDETVENVRRAVPPAVPIFFISMVEPPPSAASLLQPERDDGLYYLTRSLNDRLFQRTKDLSNAFYVDLNDILRISGDSNVYDGYENWFTHGLLGRPVYVSAAKRIDKCLAVINQEVQPVKLIITDLDETLWQGRLASGQGVEWRLGYAEALLECKRRGIVLAICAREDPSLLLAKFDQVWQGRLHLEDFATLRLGEAATGDGIAEILREVNILPENTLFISGQTDVIEDVRSRFPQIRTLGTGGPRVWRNELLYGAPCQVLRISAEGARRTELVQAKIRRERELASGDPKEYLRRLAARVSIQRVGGSGPDFDRAFELINKTNQFNTTGVRWSLAEIHRFMEEGGTVWAMRAEDRLADHGLISVALVQGAVLRQMVLSCRVFGLGLEDAFLHHLASGVGEFRAEFRETERNATAREFIRRHFTQEGEAWVLREPPAWPAHLARAEIGVTEAA